MDQPIRDHRARHVVSNHQFGNGRYVIPDQMMVELKRGIHLFGQARANSNNVAAPEEATGIAAEFVGSFGSGPERPAENDVRSSIHVA